MQVSGHSATLHTVEGSDPLLHVDVYAPEEGPVAAGSVQHPPVLLIHGFAYSSALNWVQTGWVPALLRTGRRIITVDLPGHGQSGVPEDMDSYTPSKIRADLLQLLVDEGVRPLRDADPGSGVDIIGYSLGSRLAWEFGATQPELVRRLVLGGPNPQDPLADFDLAATQQFLADGTPIADPSTAELLKMARSVPNNNIFGLLSLVEAIKLEPFVPAEAVPRMPIMLVAGEHDERAARMDQLAALAAGVGGSAQQHVVPGRSHNNTITSRVFKDVAIAFLDA